MCSLPHIITVHISIYKKRETLQEDLDLSAAITIANEMMFVKVALDAFIYAWRLTKYRRSLKLVLTRRTNQVLPETTKERTMENFTFQQHNPESSSRQFFNVNDEERPNINLHGQP